MAIEISVTKIAKALLVIVFLLTAAGIVSQYYKYFLGHNPLPALVKQFDLNDEHNIPTWYQTCTLLLCSFLLVAIAVAKAREKDSYAPHWKVLSVIFLLLSIDEAASVHELSVYPLMQATQHISVFLLYASWVIPAGAFVLITSLAYLRFLKHLPPNTRGLFLAAGILYVGGALGIELVQGYYEGHHGLANITFTMSVLEESLEMLGIVVFLYALMTYLASHMGAIAIRFNSE